MILIPVSVGVLAIFVIPHSQTLAEEFAQSYRQPTSDPSPGSTYIKGTRSSAQASSNKAAVAMPTDCTSPKSIHSGLDASTSYVLKKVAQYEQVCRSGIVDRASFFTMIPTTLQEARDNASDVIEQLKEFSKYGISPIVFLEPRTNSGLMDMKAYQAGTYDDSLELYFSTIKSAQISDAMMGTWVPFPEGNTPVWSSVNPSDFAGSVTKTVTFQKKHFPSSKASIILDNQSYPQSNSWLGGHITSFTPYLQNIPSGIIDSFGLQGFPWSPPLDEQGVTLSNPASYLRPDLAIEAARVLGVQDIWLNTGTYGVKYANQPGRQVVISENLRLEQLVGVATIAKTIKNQGFNVSVHLFSQDKSNVAEATNWSYWSNNNIPVSPTVDVFKAFLHILQATGIPLWIFDIKL